MNTLSWLFYFADVAGSADGWLSFLSVALTVLAIVGTVIAIGFSAGIADSRDGDKDEQIKTIWKVYWGIFVFVAPIWFLSLLLNFAVPERQTVMLIAASQAGETILTSDPAKELGGAAMDTLNIVRDYIKQQLPKPAPQQ